MKKWVWIASVTLIAAMAAGLGTGIAAGVRVGKAVPDFSATSLEGAKIRLSQSLGDKATVLGLFHICDPCRRQAVQLQEVSDRFSGQGVAVIGVNVAGDDEAAVRSFLAESPMPIRFLYAVDPQRRVAKIFGVRVTPVVYVLDAQGKIRFKGSSVSAETLGAELIPLLRDAR